MPTNVSSASSQRGCDSAAEVSEDPARTPTADAAPIGGNTDLSQSLLAALDRLHRDDGTLAAALGGIFTTLLDEAHRSARVRRALREACLQVSLPPFEDPQLHRRATVRQQSTAKRPHRRQPGPWSPFDVYSESGSVGLSQRLASLDLEQLRDIIAEHGMDTDKLAMKWRDKDRVISRIVERVQDRAGKGASFRG